MKKFMMLMIPGVYRGNKKLENFVPDSEMMEKMGKFNDELAKVFKVTDINGLQPLTDGARVTFKNGTPTIIGGPNIKADEVLGGYWMLDATSKEEVIQWAQKVPAEDGDIIEIRQIAEF